MKLFVTNRLRSIIGPERAALQCEYVYPYTTVPQFIQFAQLVTRVGESGVLGFLPHLDSRPSAAGLLQAITTESRQQLILRQFQGLFPMPVCTFSIFHFLLTSYNRSCVYFGSSMIDEIDECLLLKFIRVRNWYHSIDGMDSTRALCCFVPQK